MAVSLPCPVRRLSTTTWAFVTTLPARAARASRTTINNQVYKVLTGSQKIYDGKPLFTAEHKNILAQGTEISQEAVQSMILALGGHKKKMDGVDQAVIIRPAVMVVPLGYKFQMYTLFHSTTISASGTVNPLYQYKDMIQVVEDATLNALIPSGPIPVVPGLAMPMIPILSRWTT